MRGASFRMDNLSQLPLLRRAQRWENVVVIFDGQNFFNAVPGPQAHPKRVVAALRATIDELNRRFPDRKVGGLYIDGIMEAYKDVVRGHVKDPAAREGLIARATKTSRHSQGWHELHPWHCRGCVL